MKTIKAIDKAMDILNLFKYDDELSLLEVTEKSGYSRSGAFDILTTLKSHRLVKQNNDSKKYSLDIGFLDFASLYTSRNTLLEKAHNICVNLSKKYEATVHLTIPDNGSIIYIGKYEDPNIKVGASRVGRHLPMTVTGVGKAILAFMNEDYLQKYVLSKPLPIFTKNSINSEEKLRSDLSLIKERGYAIDDEESVLGIRCVAAPIYDYNKNIIASISISKLSPSITKENIDKIANDVLIAAKEISKM